MILPGVFFTNILFWACFWASSQWDEKPGVEGDAALGCFKSSFVPAPPPGCWHNVANNGTAGWWSIGALVHLHNKKGARNPQQGASFGQTCRANSPASGVPQTLCSIQFVTPTIVLLLRPVQLVYPILFAGISDFHLHRWWEKISQYFRTLSPSSVLVNLSRANVLWGWVQVRSSPHIVFSLRFSVSPLPDEIWVWQWCGSERHPRHPNPDRCVHTVPEPSFSRSSDSPLWPRIVFFSQQNSIPTDQFLDLRI